MKSPRSNKIVTTLRLTPAKHRELRIAGASRGSAANLGCVDKVFGSVVKSSTLPAGVLVDVKQFGIYPIPRGGRECDFITDRPLVISQLQLRVVDTVELPQQLDEVRLAS